MTFHREFYNSEHYTPSCEDELCGYWEPKGYRFKQPYSLPRDKSSGYKSHNPYGYIKIYGNPFGNKSPSAPKDHYGYWDYPGFGYHYPFLPPFVHKYGY